MPDKSVEDQLCQLVAKIEVDPRANSEGAMTETRGLKEAQNNFARFRPYIKSDPTLPWKPLPTEEITHFDTLIRT